MALRNAFGELATEVTLKDVAEALVVVAKRLDHLLSVFGTSPDTAGRLRVNVETGYLGSMTTLSNISAIGGYNANYDQYSQMQANAETVRNKITVS